MAVMFGIATGQGSQSLVAVVQQVLNTGALYHIWDNVNSIWVASPGTNAYITLTEQTPTRPGYYHNQLTSLGTYTGQANIYFFDLTLNKTVFVEHVYLSNGSEVNYGPLWESIANLATAANLALVKAKTDLIVTGGATAAGVTAVGTDVTTLLSRLTSGRAILMDNLSNLDAAVSTRAATGAAMTLTSGERTSIVAAIDSQSTDLNAIIAKLPSASYLTGTSNSTGAVNLDAATGDRNPFKADVSALATAAALAAVAANVVLVLADTDMLQTDWTNGGRLDTILDTAAAGSTPPPTTSDIVTAIDATSVKLNAIHAKLPSKPYLTGTANSDGDIQVDEATGSRASYQTDVSALATQASVTSVANAVTTITAKLPSKAFLAGTANSDGDIQVDEATGSRASFFTDVSALALNSTSVAIKAKTDLIAGAPALEATAQQIKSQTDLIVAGGATAAALTAVASNVTLILADTAEMQTDLTNGGRLDLLVDAILADTNEMQTDLANGGRLDLLLDQTLADTNELQVGWATGGALEVKLTQAANGGAANVFADRTPAREFTWFVRDGSRTPVATNVISVGAGADALLAMDFASLLPDSVGILTADSVEDELLPAEITITGVARSQDADSAVFSVTNMTAGNRHKLKVTVTTTDGQQLVGYGYLEVV